ncbi:MAG: DNA-formamidopyrimidine glycosylase family protein [bacterium]|nr:DNA-formamidopyrimidine glycosylase family protein [bacterium]
MPELPEVETTVNKLKPLIKGKRILEFDKKILDLERRGKAILIHLTGNYFLAFHQRMSGKLLIVDRNHHDKYIRRRFQLSDGKDLAFHDVRRFGVVWYGPAKKVLEDNYFKTLGEDALSVGLRGLKDLLKGNNPPSPPYFKGGKREGIKSFLLNQKNIAGIGNICADEILWKAKIHPERQISSLTDKEIKILWRALRSVLLLSIKLGGSSMRDWLHPGGESGGYFEKRTVYGREGEKCGRCENKILRKKIAGRSGYFCPKCQVV